GQWVPSSISLSEDFARLIGYYLSKGCSSAQRVLFSFGYHEKELIEDLISILNKFNIKFSTNVGWWEDHKSSFTIKISSRIFFEYFKQNCGDNCYSKRIPQYLFFASPIIKDNFLRGVFSGDGSRKGSNMGNYYTISYASLNKELIEGLDLLLREKGILAGRKVVLNKKSKVPCFCLLISETQAIERLLPILPEFWQKRIQISAKHIKSPAYQMIDKNLAILKIKKIEVLRKPQRVYSLETKNGYFLTTGGILTHNCLPKDIRAFIQFADSLGVDLKLHKVAEEINNQLMKEQGIEDPEKISKRE
ncbi:MAG: LAGLIDADG family homing endonuclease, partial [Minisyncoccales bacterium]